MTASAHISQLIISSFCLPMVAEKDLDVIGYWIEQIFRQTNTGGFLLFSLESGKRDPSRLPYTPRVSPFTIEPGRAKHSLNEKQEKDEKQIHIGQRVLESGKCYI